jgi:hypothetical protein
MRFAGPTAREERWLALGDRYPALRRAAEAHAGGWKTPSLLTRVLMFALGLLAASLVVGSLIWTPGRFLAAGLALILAGEWLIRKRRLFAGGIEEALILCGAVAIVGQLLDWASGLQGATHVLLALSLAVLAAGLRTRNALFTTLAAIGFSVALGSSGARTLELGAALACTAVALSALVLGNRQWARPSSDRMLDALVVAMPAAAQGWILAVGFTGAVAIALALAFAALFTAIGVRRRTHAPLLGALVQLGFLAWSMRDFTGLQPPGRLIALGGVLLIAAFVVDRAFRPPRRGISSQALGRRPEFEELLQIAGAGHAAAAAAAPGPSVAGEGGAFGGGGASGRF